MAIKVKLEVFEGPLDLLLHLIQKNKVDIYDIPIAMITEQYLAYLNEMKKADLDVMSEFIVMATTLLRIKAQMLLPKPKLEEEQEDPRKELVERLIEYKRYKYASEELKDLEIEADLCFYKEPTFPKEVISYEEKIVPEDIISKQGISLEQLKAVFEFVVRKKQDRIDPVRSKFGQIKQEEVRVSDKIQYIMEEIKKYDRLKFIDLLDLGATKIEVVTTFLAVLELMKTGNIFVSQAYIGAEIWIEEKPRN